MSGLAVLVTGASSGIGLATAVAFARHGDRVFATVRDEAGREAVEGADIPAGTETPIEAVTLDVRDQTSIVAAVGHVTATAGGIDVLVNNAGISHVGAVENTPDGVWQRLFDVNVLGAVRMIRAVLPVMRAAASGTIVNVTSVNGKVPPAFAAPYAASKFALEAVSESLLFEVEPFGIRVVVVEPGQFATAIFAKMQAEAAEAAAAMIEPSPYAEREAKLLSASVPAGGPGADPAIAADVIVAAATGERAGFRHPAGADAEMILGQRARATDDQWLDVVRTFLANL